MAEGAFIELIFNILILVMYLVFWGAVFVILYHFTRFGVGVQPKRIAAVFFAGAVILFSVSIVLFTGIDLSMLTK